MLQLGASTDKGPIAIIGINDDNLVRLQAGMPLEIDLKALTPPGKRLVRAYIHFAHTYEDVLKDIDEGGLGVTEEMYKQAQELDKAAEKSRKEKPSGS